MNRRWQARSFALITAAVILFGLGLTLGHWQSSGPPRQAAIAESALDRVKRDGVLRVGYNGYPPYLRHDPATGEITGFSVELIQLVVRYWGRDVKLEWVPTSWDRMKPDMMAGKFELMVEPIWRTIPRAAEVGFTRPYAYFGYAVGIVAKGDIRFSSIADLNQKGIIVAVQQGGGSHEFAKSQLPNATIKVLPNDTSDTALREVLLRASDIALGDAPTVRRFAEAHMTLVDTRFLDAPPVVVPAGFMVPQGDYKWEQFLNVALEYLDSAGETQRLASKYGIVNKPPMVLK